LEYWDCWLNDKLDIKEGERQYILCSTNALSFRHHPKYYRHPYRRRCLLKLLLSSTWKPLEQTRKSLTQEIAQRVAIGTFAVILREGERIAHSQSCMILDRAVP
jgi:hypothetical protein